MITYNSIRPTTTRLPEYWQNYNISIPAYLKGHIQHMYSWWWVELSPETCRVKPLRRINAIVGSCWIYFTIIHMFYIPSDNGRHPVTKTFTPLHSTSLHFTPLHSTSLHFTPLHYTSLHFPTLHSTSLHLSTLHFFSFKPQYSLIWLNPIYISYRSISPHITTFHLTSLHCIFRRFSSQLFFHPVYNCFPNSASKNFRFIRESS